MSGPLKGIKVTSFAQIAQGPHATELLGDLGADVIKIERAKAGEFMRSWSQGNCFLKGESASFLSLNRNKRSITIDLKSERGLEIVYKLVERADILVENFRPGVMDKLGLGYDRVSQINPGIIYCASSGYGRVGPYKDRPGQDLLAQAMSGFMSITGWKDSPPTPAGSAIADWLASGLMISGILAALYHREKTGEGQRIDVNLLDSMIDLQAQEALVYLNTGREPERGENHIAHVYHEAPYGVYMAKDRYMVISLNSLSTLSKILGIEDLGKRYPTKADAMKYRNEIAEVLEKGLKKRSAGEWIELFAKEDIWCGLVKSYQEVFSDEQVKTNEMVITYNHPTVGEVKAIGIPIKLSKTPCEVRFPPPLLGQHTKEILKEIGYSEEAIKSFEQDGTI